MKDNMAQQPHIDPAKFHGAFSYEQCDVPTDMTLVNYRRASASPQPPAGARRLRVRRVKRMASANRAR
ncbi:MAG: hypothetical protein ACR2HD_09205 [Solirubrobacteraceae bacterium]|nr:MAG: hypothetical protein DLM63_11840 [Solirubrobacterales bacterium]